MSIREFAQALRTTQGQHILASVLEGPEQGQRLLLCEGVPVWPPKPEGLLARHLPALAGCGASGLLTLEGVRVFVEKFGGTSRLVLCGGGHVAESVVRLAVMLGLPVTGLEERPDYADALRRAGAETVLCGPYAEMLARVEGSAETYFVVATRAHAFDVECLTEICKKRSAYVGMLGSRSRAALVRRQLTEAGADPVRVEGLHAPIGLAIGGQTAPEIALSILAEIVQLKNSRQQTVEGFIVEVDIHSQSSIHSPKSSNSCRSSTFFFGFGSNRLRTRCGESSFTVAIWRGSSLHVMKYCAFFITTPIFFNS